MSSRKNSRALLLDVNKCVENVGGNRFNLVLIAAARAKEIAHAHKKSESTEYVSAHMESILEVQSGKTGIEYLTKYKK